MKTAEEWHHSPKFNENCLKERLCFCTSCEYVRAIQLDAMKEGMKRAAEIVREQKETAFKGTTSMNQYGIGVKQGLSEAVTTIICASENLTEKEL